MTAKAGAPSASSDSLISKLGSVMIVFAFTFLGMWGFAMIGSLAYPIGGVGAIAGAIVGVFSCGLVSFCATGLWRELIPADVRRYGFKVLLPETVAGAIGNHYDFTLIVTVHELEDLQVKGLMPWNSADTFVELELGSNPIKATCVRHDGRFNEQFRFHVSALDENCLIRIKDQDVFGSTDVGYVSIDIFKEVIEDGFPWRKDFKIEAWDNDKIIFPKKAGGKIDAKNYPRLILSFDRTDDFPERLLKANPLYQKSRTNQQRDTLDGLKHSAGKGSYGTLGFISTLEFNNKYKVVKHAEDDLEGKV